jgi:DNA-binding transcriptional MerR regulator
MGVTMSDNFELPDASDKLPLKFILDTIREQRMRKAGEVTETHEETIKVEASGTEILSEPQAELCGREAEYSDPSQEIPVEELETVTFEPLSLPDKKYFRIGEVSELVGVEAYVLRYWESEFPVIKPVKSSSGHRVYSRKDVENLNRIRHLLHEEKFSIKGARKKLLENRKEEKKVKEVLAPNREVLKKLATELRELIHLAR